MTKSQLLILLCLVALAFYLNSEKPVSKPALKKPWIISPPTSPASFPSAPSVPSFPKLDENPIEATDYSWLTDDNLEFILKNWTPLKEALKKANQTLRKFHLRTDIANLYNCFYKAQTKQDWDLPEFLERLEDNKHQYTLFPLRVNGNHWGLFMLEDLAWQETESIYQVYYTSSGGGDLNQEKQQLQPFINQLVGAGTPIQIITPKDRKSKGYECGVYLCFYIKEILETGKLELTRTYTSEQCQEFRREWRERIGESWGRWD